MGVKAPDVNFVLAPQGPLQAPKAQVPRGVWIGSKRGPATVTVTLA